MPKYKAWVPPFLSFLPPVNPQRSNTGLPFLQPVLGGWIRVTYQPMSPEEQPWDLPKVTQHREKGKAEADAARPDF